MSTTMGNGPAARTGGAAGAGATRGGARALSTDCWADLIKVVIIWAKSIIILRLGGAPAGADAGVVGAVGTGASKITAS